MRCSNLTGTRHDQHPRFTLDEPPAGAWSLRIHGVRHEGEATSIVPGLHVVATPIGNFGDISFRALGTLAAADAMLAEDTRVTKTLLAHYGITTPLLAYHEHNAEEMRPRVLARLGQGRGAGPRVGCRYAAGFRSRLQAGAKRRWRRASRCAVPGASAVLAALVVAGLPTDRFFFEGFLPPRSAARARAAGDLNAIPGTLVFFESPRRVAEMLADAAEVLGAGPPPWRASSPSSTRR